QPLRYVAGDGILAKAATFYSPDAPSYLSAFIMEHIKRDGLVVICEAQAEDCIDHAVTVLGDGIRHTRAFAARYLGQVGQLRHYVILLYSPAVLDSQR